MDLNVLVKNKRYKDLFVISRYLYRIGKPIISDEVYDKLERSFRENNILPEYLNRTYDDDPIPAELLKEFNLLHLIPKETKSNSEFVRQLDEDKSLSIKALTTVEEVFNFIKGVEGEDIIVSLKVDGVNSKTLYVDGNYELSLSRARDGDAIDYTKNIKNCLPKNIETDKKFVKVFAECFVFEKYLPVLRRLDPDSYKTPKSSAISLLRVSHDIQHYKYLKVLAFAVDGVSDITTKEEEFKYLQQNGFTVSPYKVFKAESIPKDFNNFEKWLLDVCDLFSSNTSAIPSDGLVFEVNNLKYEATITNQYSSRNIAVKLAQWKHKKYKGVVEEILIEQKRVKASCRVKIKPIKTADSCSAEYINVFNPSILISQGINVGSEIEFERNSGAVNILLYGKRLDSF